MYPNEIKDHKEQLKQEQYIEGIKRKIDQNYKLEIKGKEIFSKKVKKEMIEKYKDMSNYFIDYEDDKKIIYIRKQPPY